MFGVRTAVRTTLVPMASKRHANRAPSLASRSTTGTSGWMSSVVLRACCAHQSSDGARVTAACTILRFETRIPSLSNSPRSRSAPHLWFRAAISRISGAWRVGLRPRARDCHRHRRRSPPGATEAQWPAAPASPSPATKPPPRQQRDRQALRAREHHSLALQPTLRSRQLLSEKLVLCHERCARTELPHYQPHESAEHRGSVSRGGGPWGRIGAVPRK